MMGLWKEGQIVLRWVSEKRTRKKGRVIVDGKVAVCYSVNTYYCSEVKHVVGETGLESISLSQ